MNKNRKILVVVTVFPSITETFILNQITDLIDKGFDITIFTYNKSKDTIIHQLFLDYNLEKKTITHFKNQKSKWLICKEGLSFFLKYRKRIDFKKLFSLLNPIGLKTNLKKFKTYYDLPVLLFKENFDVVHCHFGFNGKKVADAYEIGICNYPSAILSFHGSDLTPSKVEIYKEAYKNIFKYFKAYTVNSLYLQNILLEVNPAIKNYHLLQEGIKKQYLEPHLVKEKKISNFDIVFCGRLINWKGPDRALRIVKKIIDAGYLKFRLHIIGNGEMMDELKSLTNQLDINDHVIFHGSLSQNNVFKVMAASSAFLLPGIAEKETKRSEAQGLVLQEAQFFKMPVITSNVGGIKYGMIPNETGFLVESENEDEFVEKLILLYNNLDLRVKMGENGHSFVLKEFESNIIGDKLISIYRTISWFSAQLAIYKINFLNIILTTLIHLKERVELLNYFSGKIDFFLNKIWCSFFLKQYLWTLFWQILYKSLKMFFTRLKFLTRVFISKAFLPYLYNKYVKNNEVIIEDINQNFHIRSQKRNLSLKKKFLHLLVYYPEFAFVFFWRIKSNFFFWKILYLKNFCSKIFLSSNIQGGLVCYHPYASVINAKSIGRNFVFRNGLTIGNKNNDNEQLPVIGDNVEVGANAVIIGNVEIGDNVIIGAGSVVVKSFPSNCVIAGNPARIIKELK